MNGWVLGNSTGFKVYLFGLIKIDVIKLMFSIPKINYNSSKAY